MHNLACFLKDTLFQMKYRLKLFFSDGISILVYFLTGFVFAIVSITLYVQAEENARIPVGILNLDYAKGIASTYSLELVEQLKNQESLYILEDDFANLMEKLEEKQINALYIIEKGYEEKIKRARPEELLTVYQNTGGISMLVSDIIAGEMMYQICLEKGYAIYREHSRNLDHPHTEADYKEYAQFLKESGEIDFGFLVRFAEGAPASIDPEKMDNSILYKQMIAGIAAILFSFVVLYAFSQTVIECRTAVYYRKKIALFHRVSVWISGLLSSLLVVFLLAAAFSLVFSLYLEKGMLIRILGAALTYCLLAGVFFSIFSRLVHSLFWYQLAGSMLIVLFGAVGILSIFSGLFIENTAFIRYLPNSWFIMRITELLL